MHAESHEAGEHTFEFLKVVLFQESWVRKCSRYHCLFGKLVANIRRPEAIANTNKLGLTVSVGLAVLVALCDS